ncbi:MAG: hypothetical protein IPP81_02740 [Chitinophagaceae bacterium]|nr:hypothetical protein [Chitinophagaceae bacterium]
MKKNKKLLTVTAVLFVFIIFLVQCINKKAVPDARGTAFAPEQTCRQCHQAIYDSAVTSAHFNASAAATAKNVQGNFNTGHNIFMYDSITKLVMEQRDSGLYQVLYKTTAPYWPGVLILFLEPAMRKHRFTGRMTEVLNCPYLITMR